MPAHRTAATFSRLGGSADRAGVPVEGEGCWRCVGAGIGPLEPEGCRAVRGQGAVEVQVYRGDGVLVLGAGGVPPPRDVLVAAEGERQGPPVDGGRTRVGDRHVRGEPAGPRVERVVDRARAISASATT